MTEYLKREKRKQKSMTSKAVGSVLLVTEEKADDDDLIDRFFTDKHVSIRVVYNICDFLQCPRC